MDECLALADLGASINLMPFSVWEALSLLELTPTCMTLKLVDRSVSKPIGIAKDVSFKVGVFHFPADIVFFPPSKMTNLRNEIMRFQQRFDESFNEAWDRFNDVLRACPHHGFFELHQLDTFYNALNVNDQNSLSSTAGGNFLDKMPRECLKIIERKSKDMVRALLLDKKNLSSAPTSSSTPAPVKAIKPNCVTCGGSGTLPSNTITNPKEDLKGITTRSGVAYQRPTIPTSSKQGTEVTKDQVQTPSSQNMSFEISFTDALILMPKFASTLKALIGNKEKFSEMARTLMNEHCSAVILNKLPRKLGDPGKYLIPCEFPRMDECLALADLGASINLMPLSVWEGLLLPKLTPTCMTLELADRSVSKPIGIAKDVLVKTDRALIDVHKGELTLCIRNEAITYNLDQTSRYSANYNQMTANKIDVICEVYSQEVLGFSDVTVSGNPTPFDDLIVSTTSPTLTPFGDSDFLLFEEADAFFDLEDDPNLREFNPFYYDPKGDILLLEAILNSEPLPPIPNHEQYMPSFKKELKGINLKFCTHKILMEEDYKPAIQHQRRVNPKIHDVIKKEVEKLLDAGMIYPISDSPWVSPIHCVPKKGGFTVVENEENELILTRLVTGWRVCIDYCKLNEATRKDHFPLSFMDQMLERLSGNEYYCFLDGFSGYFKFLLTLVIRRRQRSLVPTKRLPIDACLSVCAMRRFRIEQYLQHEHYDLWEVIEFGDSYKVPSNTDPNDTTTRRDVEKSGRTVTFTTEDMQKKKNDVKARTTLLLSLPDEHQLRFSKYKTVKELWDAILKTFGEVKKDDLNQKFLTSLAPEWRMHTIVWRNRNDLDTMSLDDLYNHLKTNSGRELERRLAYKDQMWQVLTNQKLSASTVTRWVISQESAEHPEVRKESYRQGSKAEEKSSKSLMAIDGVGWDWSCMANEEDHALVADGETPTEFALMANIKNKVFDNSLCSNECKKNTDSLNNKIKELKSELSDSNNY
nr:reverse transcriptase domain-containing protein [Tanacetum cinerariifolium]